MPERPQGDQWECTCICGNHKKLLAGVIYITGGACDFNCADIYDPVCGTDGKTYGNKCSMDLKACTQKKFLYVDYKGECSE